MLMQPQPTDWKWGGCSDNVNFGVKFSQRFTDAPEEELHESLIGAKAMANLHNKKVGRKVTLKCSLLPGSFGYKLPAFTMHYIVFRLCLNEVEYPVGQSLVENPDKTFRINHN